MHLEDKGQDMQVPTDDKFDQRGYGCTPVRVQETNNNIFRIWDIWISSLPLALARLTWSPQSDDLLNHNVGNYPVQHCIPPLR